MFQKNGIFMRPLMRGFFMRKASLATKSAAAIAELTFRSIILAIILTLLLATSNAYLALKLGMLTSASIPAAILSMGILRFFKQSTILENNAVQTAASAGEAVAGGIVYTIPALIIIQYWHGFDYLTNFFIALSGGVLGVLFSVPLRRVLVNEPTLQFPEGRAIAEVLKSSSGKKGGFRSLVYGGLMGALFELCQSGLKLMASSWGHWFFVQRTLFGFGVGYSATMIGAGYLIGKDLAISIFIGALLSWVVVLPGLSHLYPAFVTGYSAQDAMLHLWEADLRYVGIGAMLFSGVWTFIQLIRPLIKRMRRSLVTRSLIHKQTHQMRPRTDQDMPTALILAGVLFMSVALFYFFQSIFPLQSMGFEPPHALWVVGGAVAYVVVVGFLFSVITAYFSGMVGVTASPGSSVVIAGILFAGWLLLSAMHHWIPMPLNASLLKMAEAMTIIIASVVTGIAAIANDNTQDLKVGQLVGATPWKQQVMLLLGVLVSAVVIPPVMQLLFQVYGIAGVMPHAGMDMSQSLPAPTAALLAAVTDAVFHHRMPWMMMLSGALVIAGLMVLNRLLNLHRFFQLSVLGVAVGMYLPLSSTVPLFIGGMIAWLVNRKLAQEPLSPLLIQEKKQVGTLIACGLVSGSALMSVVLALVFSLAQSQHVLSLVGPAWELYGALLGAVGVILLGAWMVRRVAR
jgi:putative OPT family oligopeptide transporter